MRAWSPFRWFGHIIVVALARGVSFAATAPPIVEFPLPTPFSAPAGITAGPAGNLWFTEQAGNKIGRITPAGIITEFVISTYFGPAGITAGPDGNLWFVGYGGIGRITLSGVPTKFALPGILPGFEGNSDSRI